MTDIVTERLRNAQKKLSTYLWTPKHPVAFTPAVHSKVFGDGRALFKITTINDRPRFWIVRGCSSWAIGSEAADGKDDMHDHIDAIIGSIEDEFGTKMRFEQDNDNTWRHTGHDDTPVSEEDTTYPVIDPDMGASWGRMKWPEMEDVETEPHPKGYGASEKIDILSSWDEGIPDEEWAMHLSEAANAHQE